MIGNIQQPKSLNVLNIFENSEYIIPIYQRNYAWRVKEIKQLLDDIKDINDNYYLGNLIVDEKEPNVFYVIDGQQRLTTLFLLFKHLNIGNLKINSLRFEAREKSNRTLIANFDEILDSTDREAYSSEIREGCIIIKNYFNQETDEIESFKNKLKSVFLIKTQVPQNIDLNHYFEVMNTRGEQLEAHEIAKSRILKVIKNPEDKKIASLIWDACAQMDTYIHMNFSKEIREKLFGENWNEFKAKDFDSLNNNGLFTNIVDNIESKIPLTEILKKKNNADSNNKTNIEKEENERFESIVPFPNFLLIVNEVLSIKNEKYSSNKDENDVSLDDKKLLDALKINFDKPKEFIFALLKYRFFFDQFIIKREYAKKYKETGKWSLQKLNKYEYKDKDKNSVYPKYLNTFSNDDSNKNIKLLQSALRITYTSPKTMHWISFILSNLDNSTSSDFILNTLEIYCCNKISNSNYKEKSGFAIPRLVFTYLDYLLIRDKSKRPELKNVLIKFDEYEFQFRTSIEHFYPQNPINSNEKWGKDKPLDSFGNLALITVSGNSKFSNLSPQSKKDSYPDIIRQSPKLMIMASCCSSDDNWNPSKVEKHCEEMWNILDYEISSKENSSSNNSDISSNN